MNADFIRALQVQGRVLWALALREVHEKHGKSRLGYLWEFVTTGFGIAVFWFIRTIAGLKAPHGLALPVFLLMGFVIWHIFSKTVKGSLKLVRKNSELLTFPQISSLDFFLAHLMTIWGTQILVMGIFMLLFFLLGYSFQIFAPITFLAALLGIGVFALGVGLVCAVLAAYMPVVEKLVPMVMRILFFTSGIFFSPAQMTKRYGDIALWNPLMNFMELLRGAFISWTPSESIKLTYITCLTCVLLPLGLLLERHTRVKWTSL